MKMLNARAASPPDTRTRILDTAWAMIRDRRSASVSLVEVARAAGVSRQTLYLLFRSRAGLLMAIVEHADTRSQGPAALTGIREALAPNEAFEPYVRAWFSYLPYVFAVARALEAAATVGDTDAKPAWDSRMKRLRRGYLLLMQALAKAGGLNPAWTAERAADWCFHQTHVDAWQHLVVEAGWPAEEAITQIIAGLRTTLLRPEVKRKQAR